MSHVAVQVRDRATLYLAELGGKAGGVEAVDVQWDVPARNLEKSLRSYLDNGGEAPFSLVRPWALGQLSRCRVFTLT